MYFDRPPSEVMLTSRTRTISARPPRRSLRANRDRSHAPWKTYRGVYRTGQAEVVPMTPPARKK
jgi:hypothetical protein